MIIWKSFCILTSLLRVRIFRLGEACNSCDRGTAMLVAHCNAIGVPMRGEEILEYIYRHHVEMVVTSENGYWK